eukprot:6183592-Pleurochrysis_carterae.AAC.2
MVQRMCGIPNITTGLFAISALISETRDAGRMESHAEAAGGGGEVAAKALVAPLAALLTSFARRGVMAAAALKMRPMPEAKPDDARSVQ